MSFEPEKAIKGVWFWQKEWWWVIAINEVIARKTNESPGDSVSVSVAEVNNMIDELGGSIRKRLRTLAKLPIRVSLKGPENINITKR